MGEALEILIRRSQGGEHTAQNELIVKFNPLLRKYAAKLKYDDAFNDLMLDFIKTVRRIKLETLSDKSDAVLVAYIHKSIVNAYSKRQTNSDLYGEVPFSNLTESETQKIEYISAVTDDINEYDIESFWDLLTENETDIIKKLFFLGLSVVEIANMMSTSRQAINQAKNRALSKIRKHLTE